MFFKYFQYILKLLLKFLKIRISYLALKHITVGIRMANNRLLRSMYYLTLLQFKNFLQIALGLTSGHEVSCQQGVVSGVRRKEQIFIRHDLVDGVQESQGKPLLSGIQVRVRLLLRLIVGVRRVALLCRLLRKHRYQQAYHEGYLHRVCKIQSFAQVYSLCVNWAKEREQLKWKPGRKFRPDLKCNHFPKTSLHYQWRSVRRAVVNLICGIPHEVTNIGWHAKIILE